MQRLLNNIPIVSQILKEQIAIREPPDFHDCPFLQIRRLADQGSCVIIGRCSGYIFRRDPEAVTLFVHADRDMRIERVMKYEGISRREAEKLVDKTDEDRAAFYQYYTRRQWGMAENYELCLDSGKLGIDGTADAVLDYLERRKFL